MTNVGEHGLSCLDGSNYAAVSLSLQANAQAAEDALIGVRTSLLGYGSRSVRRFVSTFSSTIFANSGNVLPDGTAAGQVMQGQPGVLPRGWYAASASLSYGATGTITAGTYRRSVMQINGSGGATDIPPSLFQYTTVETGTGTNDSATVNGWFFADGVALIFITILFGHGNTGSSMLVPAGSILTIRYLGSGAVT